MNVLIHTAQVQEGHSNDRERDNASARLDSGFIAL